MNPLPDLGQTDNPSRPDGYAMLVAGLLGQGITKDQIKTMGREMPGRLLMGSAGEATVGVSDSQSRTAA